MQSFRLDRSVNVLLRIDGGITENQQVQFLDDDGRCLLVLLARTRTVLGQQLQELVVNSVDPAGNWMSEIAAELPSVISGVLELRFCDWQVEVTLQRRQRLLSFNPSVSFGAHATPRRAAELHTNVPVTRLTLSSGQMAVPPAMSGDAGQAVQDRSISLVLLHENDADPNWIRSLANSGLWFCETLPVNVSLVRSETGEPTWDSLADTGERLAAALARARGAFVAVISGGWRLLELQQMMRQFAQLQRPDSVMFATASPVLQPGSFWGVVVPRQFCGQPALRARGGMLAVHPGLRSYGFWLMPQLWQDTAGVLSLYENWARLPSGRDDEGRLLDPLLRSAIQVHVTAPGSTGDDYIGSGEAFGGLHVDRRPLDGPMTPRQLLMQMREAADMECSSHFMLWAPEAFGAARSRAWLRQALFADVEIALDAEGQPAGIMIARPVLTAPRFPETLAGLPAAIRERLDWVLSDIPVLIGTLREVLLACHLVVGQTTVETLDAAATWPEPVANPLWLEDRSMLLHLLARPLPEDLDDAALLAQIEGPDGFETFALQSLQHRLVDEICDYAIAADLRLPEAGFVARLVAVALASGHADDPEQRVAILAKLVARNYQAEARPLLRPVPEDTMPTLAMRLRMMDVLLRDHDPEDDAWLDASLDEILPGPLAEMTDEERGWASALISALLAYVAHREDWAGVLALAADLPDTLALRHDAEEMIQMARVLTGAHDGLAQRMRTLARAGRISAWSHHRLAMMLAHAQGNTAGITDAVQRLLQGEHDMGALLNPPSEFSLLAPAGRLPAAAPVAPVAPGEIACIIVARNEFVRLKWLYQYYRGLGVDRFFLIDNMSDDRTLAWFAAQPDVTVLQTSENYRDTRYGVKWHNEVADAWLENRWVLTVDADEALVFDGCERPGALHDLVARLETEGAEGFFAPMFDMYADGALTDTVLEPGDSLIERFPMLDGTGYRFAPKPGFPQRAMTGGVRIRLFWNDWHVPDTPHIVMQKVPLVHWKRGFRYLASTHDMTPLKVSGETGALLHYKFLPDFHARAMEEVRRNQHYEGAREYRVYAEFLGKTGGGSFVGPLSRRYEGFETLVGMGVVTPPAERVQEAPLGAAWAEGRPAPDETAPPLTRPPRVLGKGTARAIAVMEPGLEASAAELPASSERPALPE